MHIVFIVLFVLALISTIIATAKPTTNKKTGKPFKRSEMALGFGIITVVFLVLTVVTNLHTKTIAKNQANANTTQTQATLTPMQLKAQSIKLLTNATTVYENLYAKVQADSTMTNAVNASSDFYKDKQQFDTTPDMSGYNAYKKANDAYSTAKLDAPAILDTWNTDSSQLFTDIDQWTQAKYLVLVDKQTGSPITADQTKVDTVSKTYTADLAKTKTDIGQL